MLRFFAMTIIAIVAGALGWYGNQYLAVPENQQMLEQWVDKAKHTVLSMVVKADAENHQDETAHQQKSKPETALEHAQKHLDPTYVCPMHPQIVRDEPGSCPICGMDLVAVEAEPDDSANMEANMSASMSMSMPESTPAMTMSPETAMEHAQKHLDPTYVCPMHPQIVKEEPGSCPICGMDLVAVETEEEKPSSMMMVMPGSIITNETALEHAKKHLDPTYVCPMHPQIVKDEPGSCPICGMDLVAVEAEEEMNKPAPTMNMANNSSQKNAKRSITVKIDPAVVNNLGVQVSEVKKGNLYREFDTVGYVDYDEDKLSHVHQLSDGWIEKLYVKAIGDKVKKGDLLYAVYSPELSNAQEDYLLSLKNRLKGVERASRERLFSLGFTNSQIKRLKKTRKIERTLKTYAKHSGIVTKLNVREGMYIKPQTEVMTLADLNYVWFIAEVYEKQSAWVQIGQDVRLTLDAYPGKEWYGEVDYIYPELDKTTRTLKVRVRMPNQHGLFKLNMYAKVRIYTQKIENALYIPLQALIHSGNESRVILQKQAGRFSPRVVVAGMESDDKVEIKSGLEEGEKIVVSGQFLIDSEASLKASLLRFKNKG